MNDNLLKIIKKIIIEEFSNMTLNDLKQRTGMNLDDFLKELDLTKRSFYEMKDDFIDLDLSDILECKSTPENTSISDTSNEDVDRRFKSMELLISKLMRDVGSFKDEFDEKINDLSDEFEVVTDELAVIRNDQYDQQ